MNKHSKAALSSKKRRHIERQAAKQHAAKQAARLKNIGTSSAARWVRQQAEVDANYKFSFGCSSLAGGMWGAV